VRQIVFDGALPEAAIDVNNTRVIEVGGTVPTMNFRS